MKYDKRKIMKAAWADYKFKKAYSRDAVRREAVRFGDCLRKAWAAAKRDAALEAAVNDAVIPTRGGMLYMKCGVVDDAKMGWYVYGKTYQNKTVIRRCGFHWSPETRCWYTTSIADAKSLLRCFR